MSQLNSPHILRSDLSISFVLFGSYFPAWVACLMVGLVLTAITHVILRQTEMLSAIPLLPVFYLLVAIFGGMTTWLIFFAGG